MLDHYPGLFKENSNYLTVKTNLNSEPVLDPNQYYDYVMGMSKELQLPELVLIAEYNLLENFLSDLNILKILFKTKNKTTKNDRKFLRNRIIDFINGKLVYEQIKAKSQTEVEPKTDRIKTCFGKPFTIIKEIRF